MLISNSGQTREVLELETLAKRLILSLKIIAITGKQNSPLANKSDFVLWTGDPIEACRLGLRPAHHSGYLGSKSKGSDI